MGGVQAFDIVALVDVRAPPSPLVVVLQLDAHRAVTPGSLQAAIKLAALKEKSPPLAQGDDLVHRGARHQSSSNYKRTNIPRRSGRLGNAASRKLGGN